MRNKLAKVVQGFVSKAAVGALPQLAQGHWGINQGQILTGNLHGQRRGEHPQQHYFPGHDKAPHNQAPNVVPPQPPYTGANQTIKSENPDKETKYKELPKELTELALNKPEELKKRLEKNYFSKEELNEQDYSGSNVLHYAVQGLINSIYIKDKLNDYLPPTEPKKIHSDYKDVIHALIKNEVKKDVQTLHYGRYANKPIEIHLQTYNNKHAEKDSKIPQKIYNFLYKINTAISVAQPKATHYSKELDKSTPPKQEAEEKIPATIQAVKTQALYPESPERISSSSHDPSQSNQAVKPQRQPQVMERQQTPQRQPNAYGAQRGQQTPQRQPQGRGQQPAHPQWQPNAYGAQRGQQTPQRQPQVMERQQTPQVNYRALAQQVGQRPWPAQAYGAKMGCAKQQWQKMMLAGGGVPRRMCYVM